MKKTSLFVSLFFVLALLTACGQTDGPKGDETILTVGSSEYSQSELEGLGLISVDYTNKDGVTTTYEGVALAELLLDAGTDEGSNVTFTAADEYSAEMALDEALACENCIIAFDDGSLRAVMPDLSSKLQVKDVVTINIE